MKYLSLSIFFFALSISTWAQEFPKMDDSPMDAAYYPSRAAFRAFAKTDEEKKANEPMIRVTYSRPQAKGRDIFGELLKYGEMWRVGANESTEILFLTDVKLGGELIKKGRYTLYATPYESEWELFISTDTDGWGQYAFDSEASTVATIKVPTQATSDTVEVLSIVFEKSDDGAHMVIGWDDTMVRVPFVF